MEDEQVKHELGKMILLFEKRPNQKIVFSEPGAPMKKEPIESWFGYLRAAIQDRLLEIEILNRQLESLKKEQK